VDERLAAQLELAELSDAEFVDRLYRLVLRRPPDEEGQAAALRRLREGTVSRATLTHELATSPEHAVVRALDDAVAHAAWARANGQRPRELRAPAESDSRAIEIPWVLARYRGEPRVLDVGYAFAEPAYLTGLLALGAQELVGVDLAEATVPGLQTVRADVRELPFDEGSFDVVLCVSTLEHVGADTSVYGLDGAPDDEGMTRALRELHRVLGGGGRALLTLPIGEPGHHGWYVQLDLAGWRQLFAATGFAVHEEETYDLTAGGWRAAPAAEARLLCVELRPRRRADRLRRLLSRARQ
jgi:SAM-dependent methyltransferase